MQNTFKSALSAVKGTASDIRSLASGLRAFDKTGETPPAAYHSLVRLHCRTRGNSNELLHKTICLQNPPYALPPATGVLGKLDDKEVSRIAGEITTNGYYIFPSRLPADVCARLMAFATSTEATLNPAKPALPPTLIYDRQDPAAETYWFDEQALFDAPDVQALAADPSLLAVAQAYLQTKPILDIVAMWWSTAFSQQASTEAAQPLSL